MTTHFKRNQKQINLDLLQELRKIENNQPNLPLIPLNANKQPLGDNWQQRPMTAKQLRLSIVQTGGIKVPITLDRGKDTEKQVIKHLPIQGIGILLGHPLNYKGAEYYLTAIDLDGHSAQQLIPSMGELPKTVEFSSGRPGRDQKLYLVPREIAPFLKYKKIKTGQKGDDGKDEALEFRWTRQQSVLPPSVHPTTGRYFYLDGRGLGETEIALAPIWVILQMLPTDSLQGKLVKLALLNNVEVEVDGELLNEKTLAAIDAKVDLLEVVQEHLPVRKSGKDYLAKCPFHNDKKENLLISSVSSASNGNGNNTYYCYECGASGGVTKFLRQFEQHKSPQSQNNHQDKPIKPNSQNEPIPTIVPIPEHCNWTEGDWAAYYVERLAPWRADDYQAWISVGMALHSLNDSSMLSVFDRFSQSNPKYKPGECEKKWRSFGRSGLSVASIYEWAKQDKIPHPTYSEFVRCVELLYAEYADAKIARSTLNFNLLEARKNFWSWKGSDRQWKDLVDEVRSRFVSSNDKDEVIYGNSSYVHRGKNINPNPNKNQGESCKDSPPGKNHESTSSTVSLIEQIKEIIAKYPYFESMQTAALQDLAQSLGRNYRDIELLTRIIKKETEESERIAEAISSLKVNLRDYRQRLINLTDYLSPELAKLLNQAAAAMPTAVEYLFNTLLPACASRIGTGSKVIINQAGNYTQPCIFWTANVNHSGQAKTPPQLLIISPLVDLEKEADDRHKAELEAYKNNTEGKKREPVRERFLLTNSTSPVKMRLHHENKRGFLEHIDELASDYNRLNQYKRGKGDDLQVELELFNGGNLSFDRSDSKLFLNRTGISKTGNHQWDNLSRLIEDNPEFIDTGYASRFLFCSVVDSPLRYLDLFNTSNAADKLKAFLRKLYEELGQLRQTDYFLSDEAKTLFQAWNHLLINDEIAEKNFQLNLVYPKIESYTARLALWLHIVNHVAGGYIPPVQIPGKTMRDAIEIASFYLSQHKLILAHSGAANKLEGNLLKIQTNAEKYYKNQQKGVSASFLKSRINSLKKMTTDAIRSLCQQLVHAGFGILEGVGNKMLYIPFQKPGGGGNNGGNGGGGGTPPTNDNNPSSPPSSTSESYNTTEGGLESILRDLPPTVGAELVAAPIAVSHTAPEIPSTIGEIGGEKLSPIVNQTTGHNPDLESVKLETEANEANNTIKNTNITNGSAEVTDFNEPTTIGEAPQLDYQPPIEIVAPSVQIETSDLQPEPKVNTELEKVNISASQTILSEVIESSSERETLTEMSQESISDGEAAEVGLMPFDSIVAQVMLKFYSDHFLQLLEQPAGCKMQDALESSSASVSEDSEDTEEEADTDDALIEENDDLLEDFEEDFELVAGLKIIHTITNVEAIVYSASQSSGTVTVQLANGELATWYDYLVVPAPGQIFTYQQMLDAIDAQVARLKWSISQAKNYLFEKFQVRSRYRLNDQQLFEFLDDLKALA